MKVLATSNTTPLVRSDIKEKKKNNTFKGIETVLVGVGNLMQGIENQGYIASFLIQDGLGMTLPRVWTGYNRDKEITGKYNKQEGLEVLLREGLTGPYIMAVAPLVLFATTKFCRSTNTNTNLIKRYGASLKEFLVEKLKNEKTLTSSAQELKDLYSKKNIESIYKNSVPKDTNPEETIKFLEERFAQLSSKDKKTRSQALSDIVNKINEKIMETSPDFYSLNKVTVGSGDTKKVFDTKEAFTALHDFAEDAIIKNKDIANLNEVAAENIKNNFATKRMLTNIANVALTLGGLSVLPKIYAKSDTAPGMQALKHIQNQEEDSEKNNSEVSFKGRGINSDGIISKIGKFLTKFVPEKFSDLFEYVGHNFTKTTFLSLSIFGLLFPRGKRAWDRAHIDENGKRDMTELKEILLRDTVSSFTVVFAIPVLTKMFVNAYEEKLGFVLTNKGSEGKSKFGKFLDVINPYSNLHVLSLADLDAVYSNVNSKSKLLNFAEFINKNGGDLEKILSKSEHANVMFNENTFTLESIKSATKSDKNKKIIDLFKKLEVEDVNAVNENISKLMKGAGNIKNNKIAQYVRGLYSLPGFIATFIISPVLLGILIPMLTYKNTRNAYEKQQNEELIKNN